MKGKNQQRNIGSFIAALVALVGGLWSVPQVQAQQRQLPPELEADIVEFANEFVEDAGRLFRQNVRFASVGGRAAAMGGAFVASANDATAAYWNPAGLTQLTQMEVSVSGAQFSRTLLGSAFRVNTVTLTSPGTLRVRIPQRGSNNFQFTSFVYPTKFGVFGVSHFVPQRSPAFLAAFLSTETPGLPPDIDPLVAVVGRARTAITAVSYGVALSERLRIGATFNVVSGSQRGALVDIGGLGIPTIPFSNSSKKLSGNFGVLFRPIEDLTIGFAHRARAGEFLPNATQLGFAWRFGGGRNTMVAFDVEQLYNDIGWARSALQLHAGIEQRLVTKGGQIFALRFGYFTNRSVDQFTPNEDVFTVGVGLKFGRTELNFATEQGTEGTKLSFLSYIIQLE